MSTTAQSCATQSEMALHLPAPVVTAAEIDAVCTYLRGRSWVKAKQLETDLGLDDRKIRVVAEHSDGRILSSPGSPGYRLFTVDALGDADLCASRHESQAKRQLQRAAQIRRRFHQYARA